MMLQNEGGSLREKIILKAWEDASFKEALLNNPKEALLNEFGIVVPDAVNMKVVQETKDNVYLQLPMNPEAVMCDIEESEQLKPHW